MDKTDLKKEVRNREAARKSDPTYMVSKNLTYTDQKMQFSEKSEII